MVVLVSATVAGEDLGYAALGGMLLGVLVAVGLTLAFGSWGSLAAVWSPWLLGLLLARGSR